MANLQIYEHYLPRFYPVAGTGIGTYCSRSMTVIVSLPFQLAGLAPSGLCQVYVPMGGYHQYAISEANYHMPLIKILAGAVSQYQRPEDTVRC